jgi:hypothetical protein
MRRKDDTPAVILWELKQFFGPAGLRFGSSKTRIDLELCVSGAQHIPGQGGNQTRILLCSRQVR